MWDSSGCGSIDKRPDALVSIQVSAADVLESVALGTAGLSEYFKCDAGLSYSRGAFNQESLPE